jgi:hypothetical protein
MEKILFTIDGFINLSLGALLVLFPSALVNALGVPGGESAFYANILGAVLFGIGIALLIERYRPPLAVVGLGLGGAVSINLCGGLALIYWLAFGDLNLSPLGVGALWILALLVVGLSVVELFSQMLRRNRA